VMLWQRRHFSHWLHSSIRKELFILNLFPDVKYLVQHFTRNSYSWEKLSDRKEREMAKWFHAPIRQHALPHISLPNHQFLMGKSIPMLLQPTCYSNLSPCNLWLFPTFKETLKWRWSDTAADMQTYMYTCVCACMFLLYSGYQGLFPGGVKHDRGVMLTINPF
jgi:hypothetical protein